MFPEESRSVFPDTSHQPQKPAEKQRQQKKIRKIPEQLQALRLGRQQSDGSGEQDDNDQKERLRGSHQLAKALASKNGGAPRGAQIPPGLAARQLNGSIR
jgi:hypothetical protein